MTRSSLFYHQCNQVTEPMREALTRLDALLDRMEVSSDPATSLVAARSLTVTQAMADTIFDERATIAHRPATPQGPTDLVYRSLPVYIDDELMDADAHWSIDMRDIVLSHSAGDETTVTVMEHPLTADRAAAGVVWHQFPGDNLGLPHAGATLPIRTKEVHHGTAPWETDVPWTETKPPWKEQQVTKLVPGRTVDL